MNALLETYRARINKLESSAGSAARKKQTTPRGGGGKPSTKPPNKVPQRWKEPSGPEKAMEEWRSLMKKPGAAVPAVG